MYVVVDDRQSVSGSYAASFNREGVVSIGFGATDFLDWLQVCSDDDLNATEAFLLGECEDQIRLPEVVRRRCSTPIIALRNMRSLKNTLELFSAGVDDVVNAPVHVRELLARVAAIRRRSCVASPCEKTRRALQVFFDGRDPEIDGAALTLPRRELRILEYMVAHQGRWVTKTQIFNAIYGIFDSNFDESVVESHVSKLRKKLKTRLGYDPIVSKRFVGYRLDTDLPADAVNDGSEDTAEPAPRHDALTPSHAAILADWTGNASRSSARPDLERGAIRLVGTRMPDRIANSP
jgi:DNA-binding response OmpR family regulator